MNLFTEFQKLVPQSGVIICVVQAENADGTTSCTTLDNHLVRVLGTANRAANAKVFVQNGRIIGDAPALTAYQIDI